MTPSEAFDYIQRMRWDHIRNGGDPKKITMSRKTFATIVASIRDLMVIDAGDHPEYTICGMEIEQRDDIDPNVMFIVS